MKNYLISLLFPKTIHLHHYSFESSSNFSDITYILILKVWQLYLFNYLKTESKYTQHSTKVFM